MKISPITPAVVGSVLGIALLALGDLSLARAADNERKGPERRQQHEQRAEHRDADRNPQTRRERGILRRIERVERGEGRYRSPAWEFDTRFRHNHYYPRRGNYVTALPPGYLDIEYRGNRFYFQGGVWFRHVGLNFEIAEPPVGIVTPVLPPAYSSVWVGSTPYYYANDVYYAPATTVPGYVVVEPPAEIEYATVQPVPVVVPAPIVTPAPAVTPAPGAVVEVDDEPLFVYPRNKKSESAMVKDRNECNRWASEQTGYRIYGSADAQQRSNYRRAVSACLEGRGYTVR